VLDLLSYFDVGRLRADASRIHDGGHVDSGAPVEESPQQARQERHQGLEEQDQRHPLVVVDVCADVLLRQPLPGDRLGSTCATLR